MQLCCRTLSVVFLCMCYLLHAANQWLEYQATQPLTNQQLTVTLTGTPTASCKVCDASDALLIEVQPAIMMKLVQQLLLCSRITLCIQMYQ